MYKVVIEEVTNGFVVEICEEDRYVCVNRKEVLNLLSNTLPKGENQ